jgi:hypothetical protein
MSASSPVNITELIDRYPLRPSQIKIMELCGLVALFNGFDLLAIGVAGAGDGSRLGWVANAGSGPPICLVILSFRFDTFGRYS